MTFFFHNKKTDLLVFSMLWGTIFFGITETFSAEKLPSYHPLTE
ncbi:uncharacterized protein METZ01_LOCUS135435, partial [marine metagenome]